MYYCSNNYRTLKFIKYTFLLHLFLFSVFTEAQELPPIENYSPKVYGAENQNWAISQSNEKFIYVANNQGLLEFDGAKWKLYPSPNNTVIRSVNVLDDKIYTGCFREFGYWQKNEFDNLEYHSLSNKLNEQLYEDEQFWNIVQFDSWILFQSLHRIYVYNTKEETFNIIKSDTQLPKVFKVDDSIYFQKMEKGIYKIENGIPILITDHPILKKNILVNIFSINEKILFQTQENGFYNFNDQKITKWNITADEVISSISVYSSIRLKDGSFIIGTISNGIYQLDKNGNIVHEINQKKGLNNNTVLSLYEDSDQNLWLGLDNGISVINFNSPFSVYNDINGNLGAVYASAVFNNNLYIGTNQGLFYKKNNSSDIFKFIDGTEGQVWCLKIFDDTLFCGHNTGTFVVKENMAKLIVDAMGTWDIVPVKNNDNILIQGHYNGLNVIEKINNTWQFRNEISGFDISSRYFGMNSNNQIFVSHEYKGVFKLFLNDDFTKITSYSIEESAPKGFKSSLISHNDNLLYTCKDGVFKFNDQLQQFIKDPLLSVNLFAHDEYVSGKLIADDKRNMLWGFTDKNIVFFTPGKLNNVLRATKISLSADSRRYISGYENITHINNHLYLFGTSRGYVLIDLNKITDKEYEISINSIEKSVLNDHKSPISIHSNNNLKYRENNLYFTYSVPEFDTYNEVNYSYQLKGLYNEWSEWSPSSEVSFKNLPFGIYSFNVRAQIGNKLSNNTASYSFSINRPWIISNFMLLVYTIVFVVLWILIHNLYKRHYNNQKNKLLEKKQRIFSIAQLENEKVIMKLKNEKLEHDIDSKSRELAASTMSIIKKNELLSTIKNELKAVKHDSHVKPVIKIINNNLTDTSDWEMFREAFNNADSGFIKNVKSAHPNLTPNDLRLCSYLRLNLSSKEIAPLLNISARSVEIKRYRLRKKMDLLHEKSLVEYILEI